MKKEKLTLGKVYVLAIEYNLNGSEGLELQAFNDIKKARYALKKDYEEIVNEYDYYVREFDTDFADTYDDGNYLFKHCVWQIYELDVK